MSRRDNLEFRQALVHVFEIVGSAVPFALTLVLFVGGRKVVGELTALLRASASLSPRR